MGAVQGTTRECKKVYRLVSWLIGWLGAALACSTSTPSLCMLSQALKSLPALEVTCYPLRVGMLLLLLPLWLAATLLPHCL